jgi:predicted nucleic acid-binding protein
MMVVVVVLKTETALMEDAFRADPEVATWCGTPVECASALARAEREGTLEAADVRRAGERLDSLELASAEVQPSDRVRAVATRLLRVHALRAGDALQLAAALVAAEGQPGSLEIVTLDERLALAASREGLRVVAPGR